MALSYRLKENESLAVGLIGYGAIGQIVADAIYEGRAGKAVLRAVSCRDPEKYYQLASRATSDPDTLFTNNPEDFFAAPLELIVEAAGQEALRAYGLRALEQGRDLLVTSVGAFTNEDFFEELIQRAGEKGARILLASGALPAVDWLYSVAPSGVQNASITQTKPVKSWMATPAAELIDLENLTETTCFFEGTARQAASRFPKSSNITAMLALSTAGLDHTQVRLAADPVGAKMNTLIEFDAPVGSLRIEWHGFPSKGNPSTSADVPYTVIKAIRNLSATICYGA
jgi:aspartate dehydrogenase